MALPPPLRPAFSAAASAPPSLSLVRCEPAEADTAPDALNSTIFSCPSVLERRRKASIERKSSRFSSADGAVRAGGAVPPVAAPTPPAAAANEMFGSRIGVEVAVFVPLGAALPPALKPELAAAGVALGVMGAFFMNESNLVKV